MKVMLQICPLILTLASAPARAAAPEKGPAREIYRSDDLNEIVATQTLKLTRIDAVLRGLELRPGMTILDIGAGSGQQSYKLAAALKGTGKVYAADINPQLVDYVASEAKKRGLSNLEARLVSPQGVDPFYAAQSYDLILMYDVYNYLTDRVEYYRKLRSFLKPGGRIALVESESVPDRSFYREDISDWPGLVAKLRQEPLDGPAGKALGAPLRRLLEGAPGADDPETQRAVLFHFNRVLDQKLYLQFSDGAALRGDLGLTEQERPYAAWLLRRMTLDDVSRRDLIRTELQLFRLMQGLNKLIVIARYRPFLASGDVQPYWSRGYEVRWYREDDPHINELAAAGFVLERRTPLPPYQSVWIFKAAP